MVQSRQTKQKEITSSVIEKQKGFFTAEDIFKKAKSLDKSIGIATVYRFLKDLKKRNRIYSYICDRKTLYSKENKNHCHFICERTGKIIHFELNNLDFLKTIRKQIPGNISSFQLEVHGVCDNCSRKD
jgi:Fe2+ or Zn2+ uptake regulation protein